MYKSNNTERKWYSRRNSKSNFSVEPSNEKDFNIAYMTGENKKIGKDNFKSRGDKK